MARRIAAVASALVAASLVTTAVAQQPVTMLTVGGSAASGQLEQGRYAYFSFTLMSSSSVRITLRPDPYGDPDLAVSMSAPPLNGGALTSVILSASASGSDSVVLSSSTVSSWPAFFPAVSSRRLSLAFHTRPSRTPSPLHPPPDAVVQTFYVAVYGYTATQYYIQVRARQHARATFPAGLPRSSTSLPLRRCNPPPPAPPARHHTRPLKPTRRHPPPHRRRPAPTS